MMRGNRASWRLQRTTVWGKGSKSRHFRFTLPPARFVRAVLYARSSCGTGCSRTRGAVAFAASIPRLRPLLRLTCLVEVRNARCVARLRPVLFRIPPIMRTPGPAGGTPASFVRALFHDSVRAPTVKLDLPSCLRRSSTKLSRRTYWQVLFVTIGHRP